MNCPHLTSDQTCRVAAEIAGQPPAPNPEACEYCTRKGTPPQAVNDVTVSLAIYTVRNDPARTKALLAQYGHLLRGRQGQDGSSRLDRVRNGHGPGSQLWRLLESLGVQHSADCQCLTRAEQMNAWGPAGCREHRDDIIAWMRQGQDRFGWRDKLTAATRAVTTGLAFRLNPLDPFPGIIDEAIRRAERETDVHKAAEFGRAVGPVAQVRPRKLILKTGLCPGDILTLTAAVESLHRTYPGSTLPTCGRHILTSGRPILT